MFRVNVLERLTDAWGSQGLGFRGSQGVGPHIVSPYIPI